LPFFLSLVCFQPPPLPALCAYVLTQTDGLQRNIALVGTLVQATGSVLAGSCTTNLPALISTAGIMFGIGESMVFFATAPHAATYFHRRRNIAWVFFFSLAPFAEEANILALQHRNRLRRRRRRRSRLLHPCRSTRQPHLSHQHFPHYGRCLRRSQPAFRSGVAVSGSSRGVHAHQEDI
jgi:hypothetical protein